MRSTGSGRLETALVGQGVRKCIELARERRAELGFVGEFRKRVE